MKTFWTPLAARRAEEITDFISTDDPEAARAWMQALRDKLKRLVRFPGSGRVVPELGKPEVREIIHGNYRAIYKIHQGRVVILTIRHAKRRMDPGELGQ